MRMVKIRCILLIPLLSIFTGCQKHPSDFRTKFLGDYIFSFHCSSIQPTGVSLDTTFIQDGKIGYGTDRNSILISFSDGESSEFVIYEDGTLEKGGCIGEFESTKIINYSCSNYSIGSHSNCQITGYKK